MDFILTKGYIICKFAGFCSDNISVEGEHNMSSSVDNVGGTGGFSYSLFTEKRGNTGETGYVLYKVKEGSALDIPTFNPSNTSLEDFEKLRQEAEKIYQAKADPNNPFFNLKNTA